jgi:hypothetical protein
MTSSFAAGGDTARVAHGWGARGLMWIGFPALGGGAGWALPWVLDRLAEVSFPFMRAPIEFAASIPEPWATLGFVAAGCVGGLLIAGEWHEEALAVEVSRASVTLTRKGREQTVPGTRIAWVYRDGSTLVLLDPGGRELAREPSDLELKRLRDAFTRHGYRWADEDPFTGTYRRWVEDLPDLPAGADALFRARQRALDRGDKKDAAQLRTELGKLGVVVRDEGKTQFWRLPT